MCSFKNKIKTKKRNADSKKQIINKKHVVHYVFTVYRRSRYEFIFTNIPFCL